MRKVCVKIYKYDELSDSAKEKARQWWIECEAQDYAWAGENKDTLKAFCEIFPVKVTDWEYGYQNYINFSMQQQAFDMRRQGLKIREIAHEMGRQPENVRQLLARAANKLDIPGGWTGIKEEV